MMKDTTFEAKDSTFTVGALSPFDIDPLIKIAEQWVRNSETGSVFQNEIAEIRNRMETNAAQYIVVRDSNGIAVGMCGLRVPEEKLQRFSTKPTLELINVFLDKNLQGKGIGYVLLKTSFLLAQEQGYKAVIWSSGRRYQASSWEFYRKVAGEPVAEVDGFFGAGSYACIWEKIL
jgi:GNAT superfamily N-acetyltransferase